MGVVTKTKFSEISKSHYLFSTFNFFRLRKLIDEDLLYLQVRLSEYFEIISGFAFSSKDYSDEGVSVCRIGDISKYNELLIDEMLLLPEEYADDYSKYRIQNNDILIGLTGDGKFFKTCYVENLEVPILLNQRVGIIRVKPNVKNISAKFVSLLFNSDKVQNQIRIVAMGKTQKNVSPFDILNVKIPKLELGEQNELLQLIQPIETEITQLKNSKLKPLDIINKVFGEEYQIDIALTKILDETRKLNIKFSNIYADNSNLRSGIRWSKMQYIQSELYKNIDCIKTLGQYIIKSNNGWSPLSVENGEGTAILGQESFTFEGVLKIEPTKFTEETKNNINDFYINQGDFFVSRGNTVDLVALACVVENEITEDILYPDLFIKVVFDETTINKQYLTFVFNSFFGRLYFKYVAKGKNQTMVKISSIELNNFHLPIPSIEKQTEIVKKIKAQIDSQKLIDQQIEYKQQQINEIIENAIKTE